MLIGRGGQGGVLSGVKHFTSHLNGRPFENSNLILAARDQTDFSFQRHPSRSAAPSARAPAWKCSLGEHEELVGMKKNRIAVKGQIKTVSGSFKTCNQMTENFQKLFSVQILNDANFVFHN